MNTETLTITLPPDVAAMLAQMAIETEQSASDLAVALLTDVLQDDALAHGKAELSIVSEPAPAPEPEPVKRTIGRPPGAATDKLPKVRKKTSAEIRHEARNRDPILAAKEAHELQKRVPLPAKRKEPRPAPPPAATTPARAPLVLPKVHPPSGEWSAAEDQTIRNMRSVHAGPYDIAKALKRGVNDVRRRIAELWVKK